MDSWEMKRSRLSQEWEDSPHIGKNCWKGTWKLKWEDFITNLLWVAIRNGDVVFNFVLSWTALKCAYEELWIDSPTLQFRISMILKHLLTTKQWLHWRLLYHRWKNVCQNQIWIMQPTILGPKIPPNFLKFHHQSVEFLKQWQVSAVNSAGLSFALCWTPLGLH